MGKKVLFVPLVFMISYVLPLVVAFALPSNPTQYYRVYLDKQRRCDSLKESKILLIGYSELAFGVNSNKIERALHRKVCNMGLHAGLGGEIILDDAVKNANKGDIVVVAFPNNLSDEGTAQIQSLCYLIDIDPGKFFELSSKNKLVFFKGVYSLLKGKMIYLCKKSLGKSVIDEEYNCLNFNEYGDEIAHWEKDKSSLTNRIGGDFDIAKFNENTFAKYINKLKQIESKGARVILIPELLEKEVFQNNHSYMDFLTNKLCENGYEYSISPELLTIAPSESYFECHANKKGVDKITSLIIDALHKNIN